MALSQRIRFLASLVENHTCLLDIGCDHGLLIKCAFDSNYIKRAIASDLREQPLLKARINLKQYPVEFVISNGFSKIKSSYDACVIAGMGGRLISDIILDASADVTYIFQPNDNEDYLRATLVEKNYQIINEYLIFDKYYYQVIVCKKGKMELNSKELLLGKYLFQSSAYQGYLLYKIKLINTIIDKIGSSDAASLKLRLEELEFYKLALGESVKI